MLKVLSVQAALHAGATTKALEADALAHAHEVFASVRSGGEASVRTWAQRVGDIASTSQQIVFSRRELASACDRIDPATLAVLQRTKDRIASFALAQRSALQDLCVQLPAGEAGHTVVPVGAAGCYAPGGRAPLYSSALMTAATAKAAGVQQVVVASPKPSDIMLAAACVAGADSLLALGGATAIAALAFGAGEVPRCDVVVGPGNRFVTAAKFVASASVGIDMLAGPSELLVACDDSADARLVAADLLAQAEHDDDARPLLVSLDASLIARVQQELASQLLTLPTAKTARVALHNGFAVCVKDEQELADVLDALAPEHLELHLRDAPRFAQRVRNAGAIFLGSATAEALGDYGLGPNHVLPTGGTARSRAGLSVLTFLRARTWLHVQGAGDALATSDAIELAKLEGLAAHERSLRVRVDQGFVLG
jgi:phosphoribosyl-ATP pyrophosphohydrolase/phosphoribosyl-AMP cyclohydrolase/histidinol dehydrogenase